MLNELFSKCVKLQIVLFILQVIFVSLLAFIKFTSVILETSKFLELIVICDPESFERRSILKVAFKILLYIEILFF